MILYQKEILIKMQKSGFITGFTKILGRGGGTPPPIPDYVNQENIKKRVSKLH